MKSKSTILTIILLAALFSGCAGPQVTPSPTPTPITTPSVTTPSVTATATPPVEVTPTGRSFLVKLDSQRGFSPSTQTIQQGDEILFSNYDTVTVTLISSDGLFVAQTLTYYAGYRYVFDTPGTYSFYLKENRNLTSTIIVSYAPAPIPTPSGTPELPGGFVEVHARMIKPAYWGTGNYSLNRVQAQITNSQTSQLSITAQIVSDGQVLEERSFVLQQQGSGYLLTNDRQHYITSANVTLRLLVQGYQPAEYQFQIVSSIG